MSKNYISSDTEEWVFFLYFHMSKEEFTKDLQALCSARRVYLQNELSDSFVFGYLDSVYEVMRDVLTCKALG
ncbi:hypothetical protein [Enterocloster bolteae]|uniref:hypothetical protein n=1 Tax=Enterocloster bolteae TaxID=208479 RepID=UPI002A80CB35|nr:hypothetical protein [Enterocloster bolteae]